MEYFNRFVSRRATSGSVPGSVSGTGEGLASGDSVASSSRNVINGGKRKQRTGENTISSFMRNWEMIKVSDASPKAGSAGG